MLCLCLRKVLRIESLHGAILATGYAYANAYAYAYGGMETALDNSMGAIFLTDTHTHTLTLTHTHTDKRRHSFTQQQVSDTTLIAFFIVRLKTQETGQGKVKQPVAAESHHNPRVREFERVLNLAN